MDDNRTDEEWIIYYETELKGYEDQIASGACHYNPQDKSPTKRNLLVVEAEIIRMKLKELRDEVASREALLRECRGQ